MMISKYDVVCIYERTESVGFPVFAESKEQAEQIAIAMLKDTRRDFDKMQNLRTDVMEINRLGVGITE
jgi:hypothetical protein